MKNSKKITKIVVFSEESKARVFVGTLTRSQKGYSFVYAPQYMSRSSATALGPDLPFSLTEIKSKKIFASLYDLIPSKANPAYKEYCQAVGIDPDEKDPMVLLAYLGKGPSVFIFKPAPDDTLPTGKEVKAWRNKLHLSQREFSLLFDLSVATLQLIESNKGPAQTARRLIQAYRNTPLALRKILDQRGIYLHSRSLKKIYDYLDPISPSTTVVERG